MTYDIGPRSRPASGDRSRRRTRPVLDEADRVILHRLSCDGRTTNRELAQETGLSENKVASRIKTMVGKRWLGFTAVFDWVAAGYNWDVWLALRVEGRSLREVSRDVAAIKGMHSLCIVFGPFDLLAHGLISGSAEEIQDLSAAVAAVPGVSELELHLGLATLRYTTQYARLPVVTGAMVFPNPVLELDELDRRLIELLTVDGRQSNRAIGRTLSVSEGTIRGRLKRLESAGLLRVVGQSDPYRTGLVNTWTYTWVDTEPTATSRIAADLARYDETFVVAVVGGRHNLLVGLFSGSRSRMTRLVSDEIRDIPGVLGTETWEVVRNPHYCFEWGRLV
jgi:DNA-binding Lrp family transcriptional regulator